MITYNDQELVEGVKVLDIRRPILPPQANSLISLDNRDGAFFYNNRSELLPIEIDMMVHGDSNSEVRSILRDFAGMLRVREPKRLIMHDEPDKYVNAVLDGGSDVENFFRVGKGTITMIAPDPYYYAVVDDEFTYSDSEAHTFTKQGNTESLPIVEVVGRSDGGSITVSVGTASISFTGDLQEGEVLILDSDLLTASIREESGTTRSAIPDVDSLDFPVLNQGENTIKVTADNGAVLYNYTIRCNSRWI